MNSEHVMDSTFSTIKAKGLSWTEEDTMELKTLWHQGQKLKSLTDEVQLIIQLSKPFEETDDEIGNMLNHEAWRFEFEETNESFLSMKREEQVVKKAIINFMNQNLLFYSFAITERKKRLVEFFEVFDTYSSLEAVESRLQRLADILGTVEVKTEDQTGIEGDLIQGGAIQ